jgi:pyruvate kinase
MISKYRPRAVVYAFSHLATVCNRMNLYWGVRPVQREQARSAESMLSAAEQELLRRGAIRAGDVLGVIAGTRMASGSTNFFRLHTVTTAEETRQRQKSRGSLTRRRQ